MGRSPCCDETTGLKKGPWSPEEDQKLIHYVQKHGHGSWRALPKLAGLNRCGKSCRLRWTNYLRPDIKRGKFSPEEEQTIVRLHSIMGNKWSAIATHLPGRTDNEIKNFWNTHLKKKLLQMGIDPMTHQPRTDLLATLPQLMALASLGDIIAGQPWSDHVARLQAEAAKLVKQHCFQYLLRSPETSSNVDLVISNLISGVSSKMEGLGLLHAALPALASMSSSPAVLPSVSSHQQVGLQDLPEMLHRLDQAPFGSNMRQDSDFAMFGAGGGGGGELRASVSHPSLPHACDGSFLSLDACSTSSCDGSFNSSFWPDQLLVEETLL